MGNPKAFITIPRKEAGYRPVEERTGDFEEVELTLNQEERKVQASRCMDCGIPFCHWACPLGNRMPEWQDMIYKGKWKEVEICETNNFPDLREGSARLLRERAGFTRGAGYHTRK